MAANRPTNQPDPGKPSTGSTAISAAARQRLQRCFEKAKEVLRQEKPDHDYAHTMFTECVLQDPGNLDYVEALLENLQRKYQNNKRGSRLKGFVSRGGFKKAVADEDWDEVFPLGLDLLRVNPWDVPTLRALAHACAANHLNEVELRYLKNALDVNRKDIEVNRHCAESLARMGQFDQAIACWHRIEEIDKSHTEARRMISELTLAKARGLQGVDTTASSRATNKARTDKGVSPPAAPARPSETPPAVNTTPPRTPSPTPAEPSPEAKFEAAIARDPGDLQAYIGLSEAQTHAQRYRDAIATLKRALEAAGGTNLELQQRLEDAQIRMVRAQVAVAERRATTEGTEEAHDLARRFRAELNRQELQILAARSERYPQDLPLQYELGLRLKRETKFREAIVAFTSARSSTDLRAASSLEIGECLQQLRQYAPALQEYQRAIADSAPATETRLLSLYRAGVLCAALKNLELADEYLQQLVDLDPLFRDARARLDKLREIRDKG